MEDFQINHLYNQLWCPKLDFCFKKVIGVPSELPVSPKLYEPLYKKDKRANLAEDKFIELFDKAGH